MGIILIIIGIIYLYWGEDCYKIYISFIEEENKLNESKGENFINKEKRDKIFNAGKYHGFSIIGNKIGLLLFFLGVVYILYKNYV